MNSLLSRSNLYVWCRNQLVLIVLTHGQKIHTLTLQILPHIINIISLQRKKTQREKKDSPHKGKKASHMKTFSRGGRAPSLAPPPAPQWAPM